MPAADGSFELVTCALSIDYFTEPCSLLREVESETLINSLRGLGEEDREIFYSAMSTRAADGLRDEIESMGRIKRAEVESAQREVIAVAKRLIAEGELIMGDADDDYV